MDKSEETGSPGWSASYFMQTTEDVARAVAAAAITARSPRPSVVFSSKDEDSNSPLKKLQHQITRVVKGFSHPPEVKNKSYNPVDLTSQKRQWASFQMLSLNHRPLKEPSRLFESMVVVGLHPNCDIQALHKQICARKSEGSGKFRIPLSSQHQSRIEPILEPQVLFAYPPNQQLPLSYKDLLSFCFPEGAEVHAIEKTPSMSEFNEVLLGQARLKQSDMSFIFRLQVADDSTLYGCCVLVDEIIQKPPGLISMFLDKQTNWSPLRRQILTTRRCYCIISRLPFFEFHFGVLNSILTEERLERLTKDITFLDLISPDGFSTKEFQEKLSDQKEILVGAEVTSVIDGRSHQENQKPKEDLLKNVITDNATGIDPEAEMPKVKNIPSFRTQICEESDIYTDDCITLNQTREKRLPKSLLPLLRYYNYEKLESSSTLQSSTCEDVNFRCRDEEIESEEASFSGQDGSSDHGVILKWAKANNYGSLQILCEYDQLQIPARGSTLMFPSLEHLRPLEYYRPDETVLHIAGSTIDVRSCSTSLELAEAHSALLAEEEATALSVQTIACLCGSLRLENVLTLFAGALLEKQILVICSNLGILSALVLSIIPLIRPYQWQSLLMPVLPNDMLDFLDAPVPYIVGVKNKSSEVQSKLTNVIIVDANKNQVRSPSVPQLPRHKDLLSSLSPYHSTLVGESYLGRKRPIFECTDVQAEAAKGFLSVLRSYLDSLSSNLRSHTITNVQSNDDKVSLLLKESFIDSYPSRDQPFMKLFVDTQLFSVHTDLVLSFFQKE